MKLKTFPRRLKPELLCLAIGTAEAVLFQTTATNPNAIALQEPLTSTRRLFPGPWSLTDGPSL